MLARTLTAAAFIAGLVTLAPHARADDERAVVIDLQPCVPTWWDEASFAAAVRAELRSIDVTLGEEAGDLRVELRRADCADEERIEVIVTGPDRPAVSRVVDLVDVAAVARPRALALAVASCVALALAPPRGDPLEVTAAAVDAPAAEEPAAVGAMGSTDARLEPSRLASALSSPHAPAATPRSPTVSTELDVDAGLLPTGAVALGGPMLALTVRPFAGEISVGLVFAARALFGAAHDVLGDVEAAWLTGALGVVVELALDGVRLGARLSLGVGATLQRGVAGRPGVVAGQHVAPTIDTELGVHADIHLGGPVFLVLGAQAAVLLLGLQAEAATRSTLALRDVFPSIRAGIGVDF